MYFHIEAKEENEKITIINNVSLAMLSYQLKWLTVPRKIKEIKITTSEKEIKK